MSKRTLAINCGSSSLKYALLECNPIPDIIAERHAEDRVTWITTGLSAKEIVGRYGGGVARRVLERATLTQMGGVV